MRTHYIMQLIKNSVHTPIVQSMSEFVFVYTFTMFYLNSKQKHNIFIKSFTTRMFNLRMKNQIVKKNHVIFFKNFIHLL